jgi:hypothetical protein
MLPDKGAAEELEDERGAILLLEKNGVPPADREKHPGRSAQNAIRILEAGEKGIRAFSRNNKDLYRCNLVLTEYRIGVIRNA